ncbi:hypothetical protein [Actinomadura sp. 21ATH]|uniref:hypothetical protein n=1 Tax=Actinomadura sp. 21ATH TaxID=1735444 RepID=UPI0035BF0568
MTDRRTDADPLAALGAFLTACGFLAEPATDGLRVVNPQALGCCGLIADTISLRPDAHGGPGVLWTSWGEPVGPATRITDAALIVMAYLSTPVQNRVAGR